MLQTKSAGLDSVFVTLLCRVPVWVPPKLLLNLLLRFTQQTRLPCTCRTGRAAKRRKLLISNEPCIGTEAL